MFRIGRKLAYWDARTTRDGLCGATRLGRESRLTPFSPICVIEPNREGIESCGRIGVCREYNAVSDRDSCNGLVNLQLASMTLGANG